MRYFAVALALVVLTVVFAAGCGEKEEGASRDEVSSEQVKQEAKESMEAAKTYTLEHKDQYVADLEEQLEQYQGKIEELRKKAQLAGQDTKASLEEKIQALEKQQESVRERLAELKSASGNAWTDLKAGTDSVMSDLRKTYEKIVAEYKK
jgi:TolA-binding protein